jgi:hypothetical protein
MRRNWRNTEALVVPLQDHSSITRPRPVTPFIMQLRSERMTPIGCKTSEKR